MPKLMCRRCGELCYLTELSPNGYCYECAEYYDRDYLETTQNDTTKTKAKVSQ